ncbi:MAG: hypothetical protein CVV12_14035 [Gammaproteobacteria bacterium HGW-Gammaproteobacteria-2]|nr:MAG: hypothetical protein CVV12_14035 [Gammaproteobacteria bacterium HGW-Gammaproteobacteria-2]
MPTEHFAGWLAAGIYLGNLPVVSAGAAIAVAGRMAILAVARPDHFRALGGGVRQAARFETAVVGVIREALGVAAITQIRCLNGVGLDKAAVEVVTVLLAALEHAGNGALARCQGSGGAHRVVHPLIEHAVGATDAVDVDIGAAADQAAEFVGRSCASCARGTRTSLCVVRGAGGAAAVGVAGRAHRHGAGHEVTPQYTACFGIRTRNDLAVARVLAVVRRAMAHRHRRQHATRVSARVYP